MAETAVVNPRRRRRRRKRNENPRRRRRHHYGAARRHRRRNPSGYAFSNGRRRRRRNPSGYAFSNGRRRSIARRSNPSGDLFDLSRATQIVPAATAGVFAARWATKFAGPFEADASTGQPAPGIKHAIALLIASKIGGDLIGDLFHDPAKGEIAEIAALGFAGDLFARKRFFAARPGSPPGWMEQNLYLEGFEEQSALGEEYVDAMGQRYVRTPAGWMLAGGGMGAETQMAELAQQYPAGTILQMPNGDLVQVQGDDDDDDGVDGFESESALGGSSFGDW